MSSRFIFIARLSPSRLAHYLIENRKAYGILTQIDSNYELPVVTELRYEHGIIVSVSNKRREYLHKIVDLPCVHIDIKAAMLQARLIWIPKEIGIESERAKQLMATESPHLTFAGMMEIEKSKSASIRLLTNYDLQHKIDYIDDGLGRKTLEWLKRKYGIQTSHDLAKVLNHYVAEATLKIVSENLGNVVSFALDDVLVMGKENDVSVPENIFVRLKLVES